jgi:hypothetical protein
MLRARDVFEQSEALSLNRAAVMVRAGMTWSSYRGHFSLGMGFKP